MERKTGGHWVGGRSHRFFNKNMGSLGDSGGLNSPTYWALPKWECPPPRLELEELSSRQLSSCPLTLPWCSSVSKHSLAYSSRYCPYWLALFLIHALANSMFKELVTKTSYINFGGTEITVKNWVKKQNKTKQNMVEEPCFSLGNIVLPRLRLGPGCTN